MAYTKKKVSSNEAPQLKPLDIRYLKIRLEGLAPLITNKWDEKAKQMMLDKQMQKAAAPREAKDPQAAFESTIYRLDDGRPGFPSIGLKASAVRGGKSIGFPMTDARAAFHIDCELVPITGTPVAREDMVRLATGVPDIRYRAQFDPWAIEFEVNFNAALISAEQIVNMFNAAGYSTGIGEWRPEKSGRYGRFKVASFEPVSR